MNSNVKKFFSQICFLQNAFCFQSFSPYFSFSKLLLSYSHLSSNYYMLKNLSEKTRTNMHLVQKIIHSTIIWALNRVDSPVSPFIPSIHLLLNVVCDLFFLSLKRSYFFLTEYLSFVILWIKIIALGIKHPYSIWFSPKLSSSTSAKFITIF